MDITPSIPALPSGRAELEAEVPDSYTSPIGRTPPQQEMRVSTTYNPADYASYDSRIRNNTLASTYNIPIGLGVLNSPLSPSQYQNSQQGSLGVISPLSPHQQQLYQQYKRQSQNKRISIITPTQSIISQQSPFHLETQYSHLSHPSQPTKPTLRPLSFSEVREGKEKEAVAVVSPVSPGRWSGAMCLNTAEEVEMHELSQNQKGKGQEVGEMKFEQVNEGSTPVGETPTELTPSDDFGTWETWAQR
jgi:hypothetical protein